MQPAMPAAVARTTNTASGPGRSGAPTTVGWLCGVGHGSTAIGCHTTPPTWCGAGSTPSGRTLVCSTIVIATASVGAVTWVTTGVTAVGTTAGSSFVATAAARPSA